jgi:hypothetical protein
MYSDILMNGSKKFVVSMSHPTEEGRFAEMGVLFELEDVSTSGVTRIRAVGESSHGYFIMRCMIS